MDRTGLEGGRIRRHRQREGSAQCFVYRRGRPGNRSRQSPDQRKGPLVLPMPALLGPEPRHMLASQPPPSATHGLVAAAGLLAFLAAVVFIRLGQPFGIDAVRSSLFIIAVTSGAIFLMDMGWQKVHLRPSTGLDFDHDDPSWPRTLTKFVGLLGSLGFIGLGYWAFPVYQHDFGDYFSFLRLILPPWIALAIPYFFWVDRKMLAPRDGYWHLGRLLLLGQDDADLPRIGQLLLGWLIKGFFLPLMFTGMCQDIGWLLRFDFGTLTSFRPSYDFIFNFLIFIDVGLVPMGYLMSLRLTDTHLRSAEPTMLGWAVALACYEPFASVIGRQYLNYESGYAWSAWLSSRPALFVLWGSAILLLTAIYVWATVSFGARFSNLTHRGVITNGPYRWTKHPAYIAKNLSWWLISMPFMPQYSLGGTLHSCLLLLGVNLIYLLRAKTEERHLSRDPAYVSYAIWIEERGLFRFLKRLPVIRRFAYRRPEVQPDVRVAGLPAS